VSVDLALLPPPEVIEALAFENILTALKDDFITRYPDSAAVIDLESDPVTKLLETFAYRELIIRSRYNDEARALLLTFATGADLDHLGITYYQETRLVVTPANPATIPPTLAVLESDPDYRQRLALKPESWSVAGPRDAFKWHAISADGQIKDASVTSPTGGTTQVYILTRAGNGIPTPAQIDAVLNVLNGETVRPLSELVLVSAPTIVDYTINLSLTLFPGPASELVIAAVNAALASFTANSHKLGTDIVRSAIDAVAHVAGVKKVVINIPAADVVCGMSEAPYCTAIAVAVTATEY
jgi:phage-related baseplate assembly protein